MTTSTTDAKAIARIIDPGAHVESPPAPYLPMDEELFALRRKTALVQANAILSYLASRREAGPPPPALEVSRYYCTDCESHISELYNRRCSCGSGRVVSSPAPAGEVERLRAALNEIDALDPEEHAAGCSADALRGLVLRIGEIARAALNGGRHD